MAIKLGEIFVSLGLSTASFTKGLNDAKKLAFGNAKEIERSFQIMGKAALAAGAAIGTALIAMTRAGINMGAQFHDLSQSAGVAVETLSGFAGLAKQSGIDAATFAGHLGKLAKNMAAAAAGGKEQIAAFAKVGITQKELASGSLTFNDVLLRIAGTIERMPDGWQKTALAIQLGGKAFNALIPFFNEGSEGLKRFLENAQRGGRVFSGETAAAADKFKDSLDVLDDTIRFVGVGIADELLPNLNRISGGLVDASGNAQEFGRTLGSVFSKVAVDLGMMGLETEIALAKMARGIVLLAATAPVLGFIFSGPLRKQAQEIQDFIGGLQVQLELLRNRVIDFSPVPSHGGPRKGGGLQILDEGAAAAAKKHAEAIKGIIEKLREQIATFGMSDVAINVYKAALEGASPAQQNLIHDLGITVQQLEFMHKKLLDVARVPAFELPAGAEALDEVIEQAALQMADFAQNTERALEAMRGLGIEAPKIPKPLSEMQENMRIFALRSADALGEWLISGGSFRQVLQGIIQDLARMIFHTLVLRPLMNALFGGGGGGLFGGLFGGGGGGGGGLSGGAHHTFAHGGMPPVGQFSLVGERGPELFMPKVPGRIVPHSALGGRAGGAGDQIIQIDARGADFGTVAKISALMSRAHSRELLRMMQDRQLRTA